MSTDVESTSQPFNLDAILQEFSLTSVPEVPSAKEDESAVQRVRESLGLGRSLFRRKESQAPEKYEGDKDAEDVNGLGGSDNDIIEKSAKPRKRIVASDDEDEDEEQIITRRPMPRRSSPAASTSPFDSDTDNLSHGDNDTPGSPMSDDDDLPTGEELLADFRKARLEALSAKVAAKNRPEPEHDEAAASERSESPMRSPSRSPSTSGRKAKSKPRKASRKALEEMHRETQRMARNMALRPEVKVAKKIEMSSIFAKFGFKPQGDKNDDTVNNMEQQPAEEVKEEALPETLPPASTRDAATTATSPTSQPIRYATPNLDDYDSDDSLPSATNIETFLPAKPKATKAPTPKRVQFTLPASPNSSDTDSDVEILPPQSLLSTTASTPDRQRTRRAALIRSLANVKSPGRQARSPGKLTQKELDMTLSMEAAVQAAKKREERRAELKALGIDTERIVEKRDLLEEAREEARRVREDEGGEESDEEYVDDEENDGDKDVESGDESEHDDDESENESGEEMDVDDESGEEMDEDLAPEDVLQTKRKSRVLQITSDDEDDLPVSQSIIPESTAGSGPNVQPFANFQQTDDLSLTQFFNATQMSGDSSKPTQPKTPIRAESTGTGLTQFFTSTAMDDEAAPSGEDAAHSRMDILRQQAAQGIADLGTESIGFPGAASNSPEPQVEPSIFSIIPASEAGESPGQRRILKRRRVSEKPSKVLTDETSEEFIKSRKEFIEEQAEESEDDYAAWASGDEDENENMEGVVDGLIDDETKINKKLTERQVAQLYMEGELERDEREVQGLMNDITNGVLRRRRGGALEMGDWDSDDDDDDNAEERQRRWQIRREELKRRMLEDENLGKLAANPKTQAFLNAISSTTLNFEDEPDFLGEDIIDDRRAGTAARNLPNSVPMGDSQSQTQSYDQNTQTSAEIQVPATNSGNLPRYERDRLIIDELTQIEDSQPIIPEDLSLSEASDSEIEDEPVQPFAMDKVYTGFIDRAAQKRASRTASETTTRFAFKAVNTVSPAKAKRAAVSVIEADDEPSRKKIMKEVIGSKTVKRKAWGSTKGRGAVTFRASAARGKENAGGEIKRKGDGDAEKRRRDMLMLMDSQNSFC